MSDSSISIVPKISDYPNHKAKAKEILDWLVSLDIVKPEPSNCVLGSDYGYAISNGGRKVINPIYYFPIDSMINGLEIVTVRQVFINVTERIEELICPNCKMDISNDDWDYFNEWFEGLTNNLKCPLCKVGTEIHEYKFKPEWGFSNLGFIFWNWQELSDEFIKEFKQKLGCEISVVYRQL